MNRKLETPSATVHSAYSAVPGELVWRLSVDQYHRMLCTGILTEDDPVELLEGLLVPKMGKNPAHRVTTRLIRAALERALPAGWYVDSQEPITTGDSEPEPDVCVVRGDTRQYSDRHPGAPDLALVVEVADASVDRDREAKKRLYARAGIPTYWIVILPERRIEVYTEPSGATAAPDYRRRAEFGDSDTLPVVIEGRQVAGLPVQDLLP